MQTGITGERVAGQTRLICVERSPKFRKRKTHQHGTDERDRIPKNMTALGVKKKVGSIELRNGTNTYMVHFMSGYFYDFLIDDWKWKPLPLRDITPIGAA